MDASLPAASARFNKEKLVEAPHLDARVSQPLVASVDELNAHTEWFADPSRPTEPGPFVVIVDGFYDNPDEIRAHALQRKFFQYYPPLDTQVPSGLIRAEADRTPSWSSTALRAYMGTIVKRPEFGYRFNPPSLRRKLARLLRESIDADMWEELGDWWNGAFHLINKNWIAERDSSVHHHYKDGDVFPRGWSGVVYLTPDAPEWSGTTIWLHRESGRCVAPLGVQFYAGPDVTDHYDLAFFIQNRYNRLVLFRENVLHRAESGFGSDLDARLTQTLFFVSSPAR